MVNPVLKSIDTLIEILIDRNELGWSDKLKDIDKNEILDIMLQKQMFHLDIDDKNRTLRIIYALQPKFKLSDIKKITDGTFDFMIIVIKDKTSLLNIKTMENNKNTQVFQLKELLFNITKHELVPKHEVIRNESSILSILDAFQVKSRYQFPIILKTDPVAKYFNAKPGSLMKIYRPSPTSIEHIVYRCIL